MLTKARHSLFTCSGESAPTQGLLENPKMGLGWAALQHSTATSPFPLLHKASAECAEQAMDEDGGTRRVLPGIFPRSTGLSALTPATLGDAR